MNWGQIGVNGHDRTRNGQAQCSVDREGLGKAVLVVEQRASNRNPRLAIGALITGYEVRRRLVDLIWTVLGVRVVGRCCTR